MFLVTEEGTVSEALIESHTRPANSSLYQPRDEENDDARRISWLPGSRE